MGPIDFSTFVNELATLSGQAILPFFRTALATDDKSRGGAFDPVTEADRAGEAAMRQLIKRTFPTHGIVGEEFGAERRGCRICLGARSDRRHPGLHRRAADLGHADRAHSQRRSRSSA